MNDQDLLLHRRLTSIADDAPTAASVIGSAHLGYQRRLRRRRRFAVGCAAAVVLVVTAGTTLVGLGASSTSRSASARAGSESLGARSSATSIVLDAKSKLVMMKEVVVRSPVSVPSSWVSFDEDGPDVTSGPGFVQVNWAGQAPTAMQTLDDAAGITGTGHVRGYLITTAEPAVVVYAAGQDVRSEEQAITVSGHSARLLTAPKGAFDNTYATPAAARIAWQLDDHRWIQVWAVGEEPSVLIGFASSIKSVPSVLPTGLSVGLTVKGYTSVTSYGSPVISQMAGPGLNLCRATSTTPADANTCVGVGAVVADGGFIQGLAQGSETDQTFMAETTQINVGGLKVLVNAKAQVSWTRWGKATITVHAPGNSKLSAQDLAALAASVQLDPELILKDQPDPLVESSLARYPQSEMVSPPTG